MAKNNRHPEQQYLDLCQDILDNGADKELFFSDVVLEEYKKKGEQPPFIRSVFGRQIRFDLADGFPLLTTKKTFWRGIVVELLWFLTGSSNIKPLIDQNIHIWDEWAWKHYQMWAGEEAQKAFASQEEFIKKLATLPATDPFVVKWGDLITIYGRMWRRWPASDGREIDQLAWVISGLKKKPDRKSYVVSAWNPDFIYEMASEGQKSHVPPFCHTMFQFQVAGGKLNLALYQRSADLFLGVPFNIASYALLLQMVAQVVGIPPGEFVHTFGDVHIYSNHFEQVKEQLKREPFPFPTVKLNPAITDIDSFTLADITLENYQSHPSLKGEIATIGGFEEKEEMNMYDHIKKEDAEIYAAIEGEEKRQAEGLELIPSENYVSRAAKEAMSSSLTNKYSEGYPGKRYYGGQEFTDKVEVLAQERAKKLFGAKFANVQPLGGANANIAFYFAAMEPGDTILGMELSHGGHLTHGHPVTYISKIFNFVRYGMKNVETGEIDYEALRETAKKEKPKVILAGFSAYPRELDWAKIADIAKEVGAISVADVAHIAGLIAGGAQKNPFDHGFDAMTTTTHKTLRGPRGGMILVRESEELAKKVDKAVFPGLQGGPHMHQIAAKAIAFGEALRPSFKTYAKNVVENAAAMAEVFKGGGVRLLTGGTSNHLILADVFSSLHISGGEAEKLLDEAGITLNKNAIADDTRKPMDPSGIRFGSPAITTRGFTLRESARVAEIMLDVLKSRDTSKARAEIRQMALAHPIPESFE